MNGTLRGEDRIKKKRLKCFCPSFCKSHLTTSLRLLSLCSQSIQSSSNRSEKSSSCKITSAVHQSDVVWSTLSLTPKSQHHQTLGYMEELIVHLDSETDNLWVDWIPVFPSCSLKFSNLDGEEGPQWELLLTKHEKQLDYWLALTWFWLSLALLLKLFMIYIQKTPHETIIFKWINCMQQNDEVGVKSMATSTQTVPLFAHRDELIFKLPLAVHEPSTCPTETWPFFNGVSTAEPEDALDIFLQMTVCHHYIKLWCQRTPSQTDCNTSARLT